jgi:hypothetical protein
MTNNQKGLSWSATLQKDPRYQLISSISQVALSPFFLVASLPASMWVSPWWLIITIGSSGTFLWGIVGLAKYRHAFGSFRAG